MKTYSESTLLRWRRQILDGTATEATEFKLVAYVRDLNATTGFTPGLLMEAYYKIYEKYPRKRADNATS